jgi:uridine kinase
MPLLAVDTVVATIRARAVRAQRLVVAIDGRSGSGKSTVATAVARAIGAVIVPCDDFFAASVSNAEWDRRTPEQRAAEAMDWRRLKREAIEPLRAGRPARWYAFDFPAGPRADGTYPLQGIPTELASKPVVLLDGAYSARPELADVLDLSVLVEAASLTREARLAAREAADFLQQWHARWDLAEDYYFGQVRPPSAFDVVLQTNPTTLMPTPGS